MGRSGNSIMAGYSTGQYESKNGLNEYAKKCIEWLMSDDTGTSSKLIFRVMVGIERRVLCFSPSDGDDFGRCYRLLKVFPEWKSRLTEVSEQFPNWKNLVEKWDELEKAYETLDKYAFYKKLQEITHG